MVYSECSREKLSHYRIEGQSKPFIDRNLQLQLPGSNLFSDQGHPIFSSIYSHYVGSKPVSSYLPSEVNEMELYRVIQEAQQSYAAWNQMKQQLQKFLV